MTTIVTELVIDSRAAQAGAHQFEQAMAKAEAAAARSTEVTLSTTRSQRALEASFNRLAASVDPAVKAQLAYERATKLADQAVTRGVVSQTEAARVLDLVRARNQTMVAVQSQAAGAVDLTAGQTALLTRNMSEMANMLASGRSPFQVMLTQGMQMTRVFGPGVGVAGAIRALGSSLLTFVASPLTLMTVGLAAAAGAASHFFSSTSTGASAADKHLERHRDLISEIKDAWQAAEKGLHSYTASSRAVLTFEARINAETLRRDLQSQVSGLFPPSAGGLELFGGRFAGTLGFGGIEMSAIRAFPQLAMAIRRLREEAADGVPDVKRFRDEVARFALLDPENAAVQAMAKTLLDATRDAAGLQGQWEQARDVSRGLAGDTHALNRALGESAGGFKLADDAAKTFSATLAALRGQVPELATELRMRGLREQLNRGLAAVPQLDMPPHARAGAQAQLAAEFERAMAAMVANSPAAKAAQAAAQAIDRVSESLRFQIAQLSRTAREQAIYNQLHAAGIDINSAAGQEIAALAGRLFDQEAALDAAAKAARAYQDELDKLTREQQRLLDQYRDIGRDAFLDLADAIKDGSINARELHAILGRIMDRLVDMAANNLFDLLFGRRGSPGLGLVGSLFQGFGGSGGPSFVGTGYYHQGGLVGSTPVPVRPVAPEVFIGAPRLHRGLNNDEFPAILQRGERVIPRGGGGDTITIDARTTIDARGADRTALARLEAAAVRRDEQMRRDLPKLIAEARSRSRLR